jgi:hypothetical protein
LFALRPELFDIREQLTQTLLIRTFVVVLQVQVLFAEFRVKPLGQAQVKEAELHTKLVRQAQVLFVTTPVP